MEALYILAGFVICIGVGAVLGIYIFLSQEDYPEFKKAEELREFGFQVLFNEKPLGEERMKAFIAAVGQRKSTDFHTNLRFLSEDLKRSSL